SGLDSRREAESCLIDVRHINGAVMSALGQKRTLQPNRLGGQSNSLPQAVGAACDGLETPYRGYDNKPTYLSPEQGVLAHWMRGCVYRKPKPERSSDAVRRGSRVS